MENKCLVKEESLISKMFRENDKLQKRQQLYFNIFLFIGRQDIRNTHGNSQRSVQGCKPPPPLRKSGMRAGRHCWNSTLYLEVWVENPSILLSERSTVYVGEPKWENLDWTALIPDCYFINQFMSLFVVLR